MGNMRIPVFVCVLCALWLCGGCGQKQVHPSAPAPSETKSAQLFQRFTEQSGVDFVHHAGTNYAMPDQIGSGVALLDYDRDGVLDLYLVQNVATNAGLGNQLYHGEGGGKFRNVSEGS